MKELSKIIALLYSINRKYYIDIFNIDTGEIMKKKYSLNKILDEVPTSQNIIEWFYKLPINEFEVIPFLRNGSSWKKCEAYYVNLNNKPKTTIETKRFSPILQDEPVHNGLKGGEVAQLLANEILYTNLKSDFSELKTKYKKQKVIIEKLREKLTKTKNKLFYSSLQGSKKSFLETEAGQGLLGAIPQFLEVFAPRTTGLNASQEKEEKQEKLSPQQKAFIEFIKTLSDTEILNINTLYKQYLKEKQLVESQTNGATA